MKNYIQPGEILEYSNSGSAITSGSVVVVGNRVGVAMVDIAATSGKGSLRMEGVHYLTKKTSEAWTQGDEIFYDSANSEMTKVGTGNTPAGYAASDAGASDVKGYVNLQPTYKKAANVAALGTTTNLVGVDGTGSNAAPLAGTEARLDAIEAKIDDLISKQKAAGLMANS